MIQDIVITFLENGRLVRDGQQRSKHCQHLVKRYNDLRKRYNDSLEHIDLSENSQVVPNVLQIVQRFGESNNDSKNRYNDSLCKGNHYSFARDTHHPSSVHY
jgi:hypothetical protein